MNNATDINMSWVRTPIWGSDFFCFLLWLILYISLYFPLCINISGIGWLVGGSLVRHFLLLMWLCDTVKPYVLPVMDCVTARCGTQVQPTKMTLARQRVLSSSEVRASDLEHGGSWVRIPSRAQIFSVSSYGWFFTSPFIFLLKWITSRQIRDNPPPQQGASDPISGLTGLCVYLFFPYLFPSHINIIQHQTAPLKGLHNWKMPFYFFYVGYSRPGDVL